MYGPCEQIPLTIQKWQYAAVDVIVKHKFVLFIYINSYIYIYIHIYIYRCKYICVHICWCIYGFYLCTCMHACMLWNRCILSCLDIFWICSKWPCIVFYFIFKNDLFFFKWTSWSCRTCNINNRRFWACTCVMTQIFVWNKNKVLVENEIKSNVRSFWANPKNLQMWPYASIS